MCVQLKEYLYSGSTDYFRRQFESIIIKLICMAKKKKSVNKTANSKKTATKKSGDKKGKPKSVKTATTKTSAATVLAAASTATKHKIYIESAAFFPANSADGYVDHFQDGRRSAVANRGLSTAIVLPVGAVIKSMTIHYTNSTTETPIAFFLRKHQDRHSPSGEIEMSFINLPPGILPPDNYLSVTDTTFPDGGVIQDKFLHYLEVSGTGDFGKEGRRTVRGVSILYVY